MTLALALVAGCGSAGGGDGSADGAFPSTPSGQAPGADLRADVPSAADPAALDPVTGVQAVVPAIPDGVQRLEPLAGAGVEQWVLMYYTGYTMADAPVATIDWSSMTHLAFGAVGVAGDGTVSLQPYVKGGPEAARSVADAARANGVVPLLMVGGQGAGEGIAHAVESDLDGFVTDLLAQVDELGYAGLDFNWEDGTEVLPGDDVVAQKARFRERTLEVLRELRARRPDLVLTYPTVTINPNYHPYYDPAFLPAVAEVVDRIGIMSYGWGGVALGGGWGSGFSSPLDGEGTGDVPYVISIEQTLATYTADGVPAGRLLMGIGSYSLCYPGDVTGPRQATVAPDGNNAPPKRPLAEVFAADGLLAAHPGTRVWDDMAQQPYLALPEGADTDGHCGHPSRYLSYDDEESLQAKGLWSRMNGYGGTIVWEYADLLLPPGAVGGRPATSLLDAIEAGFLS